MNYKINTYEPFEIELLNIPKNVQKKVVKAKRELVDSPMSGPNIKKLKNYKRYWRLRVSDSYRLVYEVEADNIHLLKIGKRESVYDKMFYRPGHGPTTLAIAKVPEELEIKPTKSEISKAILNVEEPPESDNLQLPMQITVDMLEGCNIPANFFNVLTVCKTEDDLLDADVPANFKERLINFIYPKTISAIINSPERYIPDEKSFDDFLENKRDLKSFLLKLDDEQKNFVNRFTVDNPEGPWILKGGPGSGKSTIALYCINELLAGGKPSSKILFTTYTNSLVNASSQLLNCINNGTGKSISYITISSLALEYFKRCKCYMKWDWALEKALKKVADKSPNNPFLEGKMAFLREELEWIIYGNGLKTLDEYLEFSRAGRGTALNKSQRGKVWEIFQELEKNQDSGNFIVGPRLFQEAVLAAKTVPPTFDYIFIDEAQDLTPMAIRFCTMLCKKPNNVFLTADLNQSIYGVNVSWASISKELNFSGRSRILRKNYRTSKEIMSAISPFKKASSSIDSETIEDTPVYHGEPPTCAFYEDDAHELNIILDFIRKVTKYNGVGLNCVGVLCIDKYTGRKMAEAISQVFKAEFFASRDLDIDFDGIKVTTMHAAKGLQFPIVILPRLNSKFPRRPSAGQDEGEVVLQQRRLFYVACSRAMKSLMVMGSKSNPSQFLKELSDDYWEIIE